VNAIRTGTDVYESHNLAPSDLRLKLTPCGVTAHAGQAARHLVRSLSATRYHFFPKSRPSPSWTFCELCRWKCREFAKTYGSPPDLDDLRTICA